MKFKLPIGADQNKRVNAQYRDLILAEITLPISPYNIL